MIVVHVNKTWPLVQDRTLSADKAVLGRWPITQDKLEEFGDVVVGVYNNIVVAVYDVIGYTRDSDQKVAFDGRPSSEWAYLVGQPTPATPWGRQGDAWPVRTIDSAVVAGGEVPVSETSTGRRAVVDGVTLTVDLDGNATVLVPIGRTVTVRPVTNATPPGEVTT